MALTDQDRAVLDFAGLTYRHSGAREQALHDQFGMTPARFAQRLAGLLHEPDAWAYAPVTVKRWARIRDQVRAARAVRVSAN